MEKPRSLTFAVPGLWDHIRGIRVGIQDLLKDCDHELISAAGVAASELLENAVKYGVVVPGMPHVRVNVRVSDTELHIQVSNGVAAGGDVDRLFERIAELQQRDPLEAFVARLEQIESLTTEHVGLGIYRVAAEGGFSLSATLQDDILVVDAKRSLSRHIKSC